MEGRALTCRVGPHLLVRWGSWSGKEDPTTREAGGGGRLATGPERARLRPPVLWTLVVLHQPSAYGKEA